MEGMIHQIHDTDKSFTIDPIARAIKNDTLKKLSLVIDDHNSEIFTFELPRTIEGHDMAGCNKVEVHYVNTHSTTKEKSADVYKVKDYRVSEEDPEKVIFSWTISKKATKFPGSLAFAIHFACIDETSGEILYWWSTSTNTTITVLDSINLTEETAEENKDLQEKTATPTKDIQVVRPDDEFRGLSRVVVDPIPDEYIIPTGTLFVNANGDYEVREFDKIIVNVEGSGGETAKIVVPGGWQGTPVPNNEMVNTIYINNKLSAEEIFNLFEANNITTEQSMYIFGNEDISVQVMIMLFGEDEDEKVYVLGLIDNDNETMYQYGVAWSLTNGYQITDMGNGTTLIESFEVNSINFSPFDTTGYSSLFSITPFTQGNEVIELAGEYDGIEINVTENGVVDIEEMISEKKIPLKVNVNVMPIEITENGDGTVDLTILENTDISVVENNDGSVDITIPTE